MPPAPSIDDALIESLPTLQRLALSYAAAHARVPTLAFLALDTRLASLIRSASEPMLAQIRLAWWREALQRPTAEWPRGEPLLAILRTWEGETESLVSLVDGWEEFAAHTPLTEDVVNHLAQARANCFAALADIVGAPDRQKDARRMGLDWALADIASRLSGEMDRAVALGLAQARSGKATRLPRSLRPVAVLHRIAKRSLASGQPMNRLSLAALAGIVRTGLLGI